MTVDDVVPETEIHVGGDLWAPGSTIGWLRSVSTTVGLIPSELADTFAIVDGGTPSSSTSFTVSKQGTTTIQYFSIDLASNREATKTVTLKLDGVAPVTTSNAVASYGSSATITLKPTDAVSGLDWTTWSLDGGSTWTTGTTAVVTELGAYTLTFRSADLAGNVEATKTVAFSVLDVQPTSITIKTNATTARTGSVPILSGVVTPFSLVGKNIVVYVKRPGKTYFSYSSNRTVYNRYGVASWQYKYYFKPGMAKGYYVFKASVPAYPGYLVSTSPTTVTIRLR